MIKNKYKFQQEFFNLYSSKILFSSLFHLTVSRNSELHLLSIYCMH